MRVLIERQSEMAERVGGVARLLERAQHQVGDDALLGLARDFFREALIMLGPYGDVERRDGNAHRLVAAAALIRLSGLSTPDHPYLPRCGRPEPRSDCDGRTLPCFTVTCRSDRFSMPSV